LLVGLKVSTKVFTNGLCSYLNYNIFDPYFWLSSYPIASNREVLNLEFLMAKNIKISPMVALDLLNFDFVGPFNKCKHIMALKN